MCQCSGLLKEKAGYFERLKIFLEVTGLLGTYEMTWKVESEVQLVLFPWQPLGAHGTMVEAEEEAVVRLRAESVRWRPLRVPLTGPLSQYYQVSVISCWGENYRWHIVKFFIPSLQLFPQDWGSEVSKQRPPTSKQNSLNWSWPRVNHSSLK